MINLCYTFSERNRTMHEVYIDHCTILSDLLPIEMSSTLRNSRGLTTSRLRTITIVGRFISNIIHAFDVHTKTRGTHKVKVPKTCYKCRSEGHQTLHGPKQRTTNIWLSGIHFLTQCEINNTVTIDSIRRFLEITVLSFPFCTHNLIIIISTMKQNKRIY